MITSIFTINPLEANAVSVSNPRTKKLTNGAGETDYEATWDCVYFGSYPQSDITGRVKEPIKWRVLSIDGNDMFLLADMCLDYQPYHIEDNNSVTNTISWEMCSLRNWLNNNFYNAAFTDKEKSGIITTTVVNKSIWSSHDDYNNTIDKVYLLANDEAKNLDYGFYYNPYKSRDQKTRQAKDTAYVKSLNPDSTDNEYGNWILRTPDYDPVISSHQRTGYIGSSGMGGSTGNGKISTPLSIRPVIHLDASSTEWSYAGTVCSSGNSYEPGDDYDDEWTVNDEWSFNNNLFDKANGGIFLTSEAYEKLKREVKWLDLSFSEKAEVLNALLRGGKNGQCFGMAATAILAKKDIVSPAVLTNGYRYLQQAPFDRYSKSSIGFYYLTQFFAPFTNYLENFAKTNKDKRSQIEAIINEPKPCLVEYLQEKGNDRHAVVATGKIEYHDASGDDPYYHIPGNENKYDARILIYDPNIDSSYSEATYSTLHLYFNTDTYEWEIPAYSGKSDYSSAKGAKIVAACGNIPLLNMNDYNTEVIDRSYKTRAYIKKKQDLDLNIFGNKNVYKKLDKEIWDDDLVAFFVADDNDSNSSLMNIKMKDAEKFSITPASAEELQFSVAYPDLFMTANADAYEYIDAFSSGSMFGSQLKGNYDFSVTTNDNSVVWNTVQIKGNDPEYIRMDKSDEGVEIAGENFNDATIIVQNENNTREINLSTDANQILVKNNNENVQVLADTDSDGHYDTDITPRSKLAKNQTSIIAAGTNHNVGGSIYTVLSGNTVAFTKSKNAKSVTVPATVVIAGKTFNVIQINTNAFRGKKIRTVTIGKNVNTIKAGAFKGSKATKLMVKSKMLTKQSVKNSLKGSKIKTIKVKVGKKSDNKKFVKKYKKIFTKKNAGKKASVK